MVDVEISGLISAGIGSHLAWTSTGDFIGFIPVFAEDYLPRGKLFDYSKLQAEKKVFYPDKPLVVVHYQDGNILAYSPNELIGWKTKAGIPMMITSHHELIPSPALPLYLPGNVLVKFNAPHFPRWMFPEYSSLSGFKTHP